ncbi:hypothetical protein PZH43_15400, partial [Streptococcus gordonii]|nr:hypothetical protein [Streptococcus gordonii]
GFLYFVRPTVMILLIAFFVNVEYLVKNQESSELFYNQFVGYMNEETDIEIHPIVSSACQTVKLYHQTRQLSLELKGAHANESYHEIK